MIYAKTPFKGSVCRFARIHVDGCLLSRSHNIAGAYTHHSFVDATFFVFDSFIMCNVMTKTCIFAELYWFLYSIFFFVLVLIFFFFTSGWIPSTFLFSIFFGLCTCFIRWLLFHMVQYILIHASKLSLDMHLYMYMHVYGIHEAYVNRWQHI